MHQLLSFIVINGVFKVLGHKQLERDVCWTNNPKIVDQIPLSDPRKNSNGSAMEWLIAYCFN